MHRLARLTERRDYDIEGPTGDRRVAFDPSRVVVVHETEDRSGTWIHIALRDEWEGPAHHENRHDICRALLTRESFDEVLRELDAAMRGLPVDTAESLAAPVSYLELSTRARNALATLGIVTIDQLCRHSASELLEAPQFGSVCLKQVRERLAERGLSLRGEE